MEQSGGGYPVKTESNLHATLYPNNNVGEEVSVLPSSGGAESANHQLAVNMMEDSAKLQQNPYSLMSSMPPTLFSFHVAEIALYDTSSEWYSPQRGRLCHALCKAFGIPYESKTEILATRTDLGQFHSDNYLGLLQICSDLWALEDKSSAKRRKTEENLVKDRLAMYNLHLSGDGINAVFPGVFAYLRLCVSGTLAAADALKQGQTRIAMNWFGGQTHARKARAEGACLVNDSVIACLSLLYSCKRVLHISMDRAHCDGVEEAFYTSDRVATLSFHVSKATTGKEDDIGYGTGAGFAVNVPIDPSCFCDPIFVPMFARIVLKTAETYLPSAIVFVASPSVCAGNRNEDLNLSLNGYLSCIDAVRDLGIPMLILGGAGSSVSTAAIAWCAATARCLDMDVVGRDIPETCPVAHHFELNKFKMQISPRNGAVPTKVAAEGAFNLEKRVTERLDKVAQYIGL